MTAREWAILQRDSGWGLQHDLGMPGYSAPLPPGTVTVPDSANDVGGGGFSTYYSVEAIVQRGVQILAGSYRTQGLSDAMVASYLTAIGKDENLWTKEFGVPLSDPPPPAFQDLIAKYVQEYRRAVTPV